MPFKDPKYKHIRRRPPKTIDKDSYYTVPVTHTKARKRYPRGTIARVGISKKTGNEVIQAILIPLKKPTLRVPDPKDVWNQIKQYTEYIRSEDVGTDIDMFDDFKGGWTVAPKAEEVLRAIAEKIATPEQREIAKRIIAEREIAGKEAEIKRQKRKEKQALMEEIISAFQPEASEYPEGSFRLDGERIEDPFYPMDIYGGGRWFVIQPEWIWFVRNNGHDGDDWGRNNVQTGGAGAIGVRVKYNAELAGKIRRLAES